jgi:hypothetical protein
MVERQRTTGERPNVPTIKDLIRAALDNGKTVRQLEADSGGRVKFQTFQELSNNAPKNFPRDISETITGMAIALSVPETTVVLAYAKSLGVRVDAGPSFALRMPPGIDRVDHQVQDAMLGLMRAVVRVEVATQSAASAEGNQAEEVSRTPSAGQNTQSWTGTAAWDAGPLQPPGVRNDEDGENGRELGSS